MTYRKIIIEIYKTTGIRQKTIHEILSEYNNKGTVSSPSEKRNKSTILERVDDFDKNAIRQKVHSSWFIHEIPTFLKILTVVNNDETLPNFKRSTFQKVLKDLKFVYDEKCQNSAHFSKEMT